MRILALVVVAMTGASCVVDQEHAFRSGPMAMKFSHAKLKSGATIILEEARGTGAVAVTLLVPAGSRDDPPGKEGLAHLVGHLSQRSSPSGKVTQAEAYELLGATRATVVTSVDTTGIIVEGQSRLTAQLVSLAIQQLEHPLDGIDSPIFEGTRDLVASEQLVDAERDVSGAISSALYSTLFPAGHPYARGVEGTPASLATLSLADAKAFASKAYGPSRATLVVTGDFDAAALEPTVLGALPESWTQLSASLPVPPLGLVTPPQPPPATARSPAVEQPVLRPELVVAWSMPSRWAPQVSLRYLAGRLNHALDDEWNTHDPTVETVSCGASEEGTLAVMHCALRPADGVSVEDVLDAVRSRVGKAFKADAIFAPNRQALLYLDALRSHETLTLRSWARAEGAAVTGDPFALNKAFDHDRQLDFDAMNATGEKWINADRLRAVVVRPLSSNRPPQARSGLPTDPEPAVLVPAEAIREEAEGPLLTGFRRYTLSNGLKVLVVPRPAVPVVTAELVLPAGFSRGKHGAAVMTQQYLSNFHEGWFTATRFGLDHYSDATLLRETGGNGNLRLLLHNQHSWLTANVTDRDFIEFARVWVAHQWATQEKAHGELRAEAAFFDALVRGAHATPRYTSDEIKALMVSDLESWRTRAFVPEASALIISGDVDPEDARRVAEEELGSLWKTSPPELLPLPPPVPLEPRPLVVQVNAATTPGLVIVQLGCLLPPPEPRFALAPELLGNWALRRAKRVWRDELGAAYQVSGGYEGGPVANYIQLNASVDPSQLGALLRTVKPEFLQAQPSDAELALARWRLARAHSTDGVQTIALVNYFALPALRHGDVMAAVEDSHALSEMPNELLKKTYDVCKGTAVLRVDGDEPLVRAALKDAGLQN